MSRTSNIISKYAKRTVFANKGRSILTLIGIIVATMMFCIVSSAHVSAIDILRSFASDEYGRWHVEAYTMTSMDYQKVLKDERIRDVAFIQELGYNRGSYTVSVEEGDEERLLLPETYEYFFAAMSPNYAQLCNLPVVRGRLPENDSEAIISLEMFSNSKETLTIGSVIQMDIYARYSEGHKVMNLQYLMRDKTGAVDEQLYQIGTQRLTIVGYFAVPEYARWKNFAENTVLTLTDSVTAGSAVNAYFELYDPAEYTAFAKDHFESEDGCLYNKDFIRMENSADDSRVHRTIGIISAATIGMIVLLAVMLIYNSFSTSSSERVRAIGLLKSAGATRKQVRELMLSEAFYYSIIGIPIGLVLGHISSFFLFRALNEMSSNAANYFILKNIELTYRLGYQNIVGPIVLALLTILAAVLLPMEHVSKISPMEAVRASGNFADGRSRKRVRRWTTKIFGFTIALSLKNYFRYRRRYRATVISIMASVFMILFANMMVTSVKSNYQVEADEQDNNISYILSSGDKGFTGDDRAIYYMLSEVEGVTSSRMEFIKYELIELAYSNLTEEIREQFMIDPPNDYDKTYLNSPVVFVDDGTWRELCEKSNIDPEPFLEYGSNDCLINNTLKSFDDNGKYIGLQEVFNGLPPHVNVELEEGENSYIVIAMVPVASVDWREELMIDDSYMQIYLPMSRLDYYQVDTTHGIELFQFDAVKPVRAMNQMKEILRNNLYLTDNLTDNGIDVRARRAVNSLVQIIMYGYVAMLSFMCFLNVIMTVIGNIVFRRKEYILMMSVGMSRKTLFRMVISESLVYFLESALLLLAILFVSVGLSVVVLHANIYQYIRVPYFLIVLFLHLFVVVSTTAIGLSRIMRDEIIEGIRKEYY
ncbi:MAG: ABC transporter permease [Clostridiales bacterium]|nr:ABC transporter permease [Clostridiales bacterium]